MILGLRRHVVVFSAPKRANRRYGAGREGAAVSEAPRGFLRPGLLLYMMEPKNSKMPCTCFDLPRTVDLGVFAPVFRQDDLRLVISERNRQAKTHFENGAETKKNGSILKLTVQLPSLTDFEYEFVGIFF